MEPIKRILVVSRMNPYSRKTFYFGISLARKYNAKLYILHLFSNPVETLAVNAPGLFPEEEHKKYRNSQQEAKEQLDKIIKQEIRNGYPITELISDHNPLEEIEKTVCKEKIDLILLSSHEEGHIEHALFGGENDTIVRTMPCSVMLVKNEPGPVEWSPRKLQ